MINIFSNYLVILSTHVLRMEDDFHSVDVYRTCLLYKSTDLFYMNTLEKLTVLEIKYDEFLPDIVRMAVQIPNRQAASCSKYALCRRYD